MHFPTPPNTHRTHAQNTEETHTERKHTHTPARAKIGEGYGRPPRIGPIDRIHEQPVTCLRLSWEAWMISFRCQTLSLVPELLPLEYNKGAFTVTCCHMMVTSLAEVWNQKLQIIQMCDEVCRCFRQLALCEKQRT